MSYWETFRQGHFLLGKNETADLSSYSALARTKSSAATSWKTQLMWFIDSDFHNPNLDNIGYAYRNRVMSHRRGNAPGSEQAFTGIRWHSFQLCAEHEDTPSNVSNQRLSEVSWFRTLAQDQKWCHYRCRKRKQLKQSSNLKNRLSEEGVLRKAESAYKILHASNSRSLYFRSQYHSVQIQYEGKKEYWGQQQFEQPVERSKTYNTWSSEAPYPKLNWTKIHQLYKFCLACDPTWVTLNVGMWPISRRFLVDRCSSCLCSALLQIKRTRPLLVSQQTPWFTLF